MKGRSLVILAVLALVGSGLACTQAGWQPVHGSGRVIERVYAVEGFNGVKLSSFANLHIEIGDEEELRVEGEDNIVETFIVAVRDGTLDISSRPGIVARPTRPVTFYLTANTLDAIVISGSGDVEAPNLTADDVTLSITGSGDMRTGRLSAGATSLRISGSGDMDVAGCRAETQAIVVNGSGDVSVGELVADALSVRLTGSGNLDIDRGQVGRQEVVVNGSGDYEAGELASETATVRLTGSGAASVLAQDHLEAHITGSGDVYHHGGSTISRRVTGSGDVVRVEG
jgi:hypothetical protein